MKISETIYWLGHEQENSSLQCNPYLLSDGDETILFDPGSPLDFEQVLANLEKHLPVEDLTYIVLSHQDPDLCASVPLLEKAGFKGKIALHWRTSVIVNYYGITSPYYLVDENSYLLKLKSGRKIEFIHTPYLHFPGTIVAYDPLYKVLFSGDLFGSFSTNWQLFADATYIESMKTFHEHYMPGNDILKPIMKLLLAMDINLIAPQHGSVIRENVTEHIMALHDLECGSFLNPIKKELFKAGGYHGLCNQILKRYCATFSCGEVLEVFTDTDIVLDGESQQIIDFSCTGEDLWDQIFEHIYSKKGQSWLNITEVLVQRICSEYDIELPSIYKSTLYSYEKRVEEMSNEVKALTEMNARLETNLQSTKESLITCPVTKLYNGFFFKNYMAGEIEHYIEKEENFSVFFLEIDEFGQKSMASGDNSGDEILRNCTYLFNSLKQDTHLVFKLAGPTFVYYLPSLDKKAGIAVADEIRSEIESSDYFVTPITASIGITDFSEVSELYESPIELFDNLCDLARIRLKIAKKQGMNIVCSESELFDLNRKTLGTILIADPDPLNTDIIQTLVTQMGFDTVTCLDGETALKEIYKTNPKLVISEEVLPKLDGFKIREKMLMSSMVKQIPFILMGYNKSDSSVDRAYGISVNSYLQKPYLPSELLGIIKTLTEIKD